MRSGWPAKPPLAEKITRPQNRHHGFLASLGNDGEFHAASSDVHDAARSVTLRENGLFSFELNDFSRHAGRIKKSLDIESAVYGGRRFGLDVACFRGCFHKITTHHKLSSTMCLSTRLGMVGTVWGRNRVLLRQPETA